MAIRPQGTREDAKTVQDEGGAEKARYGTTGGWVAVSLPAGLHRPPGRLEARRWEDVFVRTPHCPHATPVANDKRRPLRKGRSLSVELSGRTNAHGPPARHCMPSSTPEATEWFANRHQSRLREHAAAREDRGCEPACCVMKSCPTAARTALAWHTSAAP